MKEAYQRQCEDVDYTTMSFEERLHQLLDAQEIFMKNKRITMNHRLFKIKDKEAALDAIDYRADRRIDKAQLRALAQLNFIGLDQNIIITGKTGTAKVILRKHWPTARLLTGIEPTTSGHHRCLKKYASQE